MRLFGRQRADGLRRAARLSMAYELGTSTPATGYTRRVESAYGTDVGRSAAATVAGGVHGFPAVLTSFIGRARPLREVTALLGKRRWA